MKYCANCGNEVLEEAVVCPKCGYQIKKLQVESRNDNETLFTVAKVLAIISCVSVGWTLIPLAWMIPMTVRLFKYEKEHEVPSTSFNVCTLLFLNMVSGILLFFIKEEI